MVLERSLGHEIAVGCLSQPTAKTTAYLLYDNGSLCIAFDCAETQRKKPIFGKGDIWRDDEVEIHLDTENARKGYKQMLINADGDKLELTKPDGEFNIGAVVKTSVEEGKRWTVEAAIPFKRLGKPPPSRRNVGDEPLPFPARRERLRPGVHHLGPDGTRMCGDEIAKFGAVTFK